MGRIGPARTEPTLPEKAGARASIAVVGVHSGVGVVCTATAEVILSRHLKFKKSISFKLFVCFGILWYMYYTVYTSISCYGLKP